VLWTVIEFPVPEEVIVLLFVSVPPFTFSVIAPAPEFTACETVSDPGVVIVMFPPVVVTPAVPKTVPIVNPSAST
jgi:hypothetical protein